MWICAWTLNEGGSNLPDFWDVFDNEEEAARHLAKLMEIDNLHCACMAPIARATEPHWTDPA